MPFRMYDLILKKRDGEALTEEELDFICRGAAAGTIPCYQLSALLMAVFFRGMTDAEAGHLVLAMTRSGETLDLTDIPGVKVDKHGLGGVAQPVSCVLGPMVAATGVKVPMISGHGMGHTRGTLDILQAIPGYRDNLSAAEFKAQLKAVGLVITGTTDNLVPADKTLLALRASSATINSIPLMVASVMSKKLAEGCDRIVIDVKAGNGGFTRTYDEALAFSRAAVAVGRRAGRRTVCLITDMEEPLGYSVGTALELREVIDILRGEPAPQSRYLREVAIRLGEQMVVLGEGVTTREEARIRLESVIADGRALAKLRDLVAAQGGDARVIDGPDRLPVAPVEVPVRAGERGFIQSVATERAGLVAAFLGAGRDRVEDVIDNAVGFHLWHRVGDWVEDGEPLATIHSRERAQGLEAEGRLAACYRIGAKPPEPRPLIFSLVDDEGVHPVNIRRRDVA